MSNIINILIQIRTVSEANDTSHWSVKHRRHNDQKFLVRQVMRKYYGKIELPCVVRLTRLSVRTLDDGDNLPMAFKFIRDEIADCIIHGDKKTKKKGMSDNDGRIKWEYRQEKSKSYGVRIEITQG